jgi:hypothetical protein
VAEALVLKDRSGFLELTLLNLNVDAPAPRAADAPYAFLAQDFLYFF